MAPSTVEPTTPATTTKTTTLPERTSQKKSSNLLDNPESKLTELDKAELRLADSYSSPDVYISGENDTLWHPWINNLEIKPLRFETRTGTFVIVLRAKEDTWLGKHRHRGNVTAVTLNGEWNYKEYENHYL
jgi:2,4'-dihydroxyacetophenone dioxygenase